MKINKDTKLYGSFAQKAGDLGCKRFNAAFEYLDLNCIYKSFSIRSPNKDHDAGIASAINAARTLNMSGFAVTMPFKKCVLKYVNDITEEVEKIGSCNTCTLEENGGRIAAHNTDWIAAQTLITEVYDRYHAIIKDRIVYIIGDGSYAQSVKYACKLIAFDTKIFSRKCYNWEKFQNINNGIMFNTTPLQNLELTISNRKDVFFIDCDVESDTGKRLSFLQAAEQFKIYTGYEFPLKY